MTGKKFNQSFRIILAVAAKDIVEALKNRILLTIIIGVLILMLTGPALSLLVNRNQPMLVILDLSGLGDYQSLEQRTDMQLVVVDSAEEMESYILQPPQTIIGVVMLSSVAASPSDETILDGYTAHWVSQRHMQERVVFFESVLSEASGKTIRIDMDNHQLYPSLDDSYLFTMIAISLTILILLVGLALVPYLFIEEKENHTMDALLVSPAHFWQLVTGKLMAGSVYCLIAAGIVLLFNYRIVVTWELLVPTVLLATAFAVALGLLMGMLFENSASMGLWTSLLTIFLLVPPLLQTVGSEKIPAAIQTFFSILPSSIIFKLVTLSMLGEVPVEPIWQGMLLLVGFTLVLCVLVVWRIRRMDR